MADGQLDIEVEKARQALLLGGAEAGETARRLLGAAFIVMQLHREDKLYLPASDEEHPDACPHHVDSDWNEHFEGDDGNWYCTDRPAGKACRCGAEWPCGEHADVLAALQGTSREAVRAALEASHG